MFLKCGNFPRLRELADSLTAKDLLTRGQKWWLKAFIPFFTARERKDAACRHRLFFAQVEYCDNLIFHRRARSTCPASACCTPAAPSARPDKITVIFGRKITNDYRGKLQTGIEDMHLPNPVVRSHR